MCKGGKKIHKSKGLTNWNGIFFSITQTFLSGRGDHFKCQFRHSTATSTPACFATATNFHGMSKAGLNLSASAAPAAVLCAEKNSWDCIISCGMPGLAAG